MNNTYYIVQVIRGGEILFCSESKELAEEFKKNHDYMHTKPTKITELTNPDVKFPKGLLIYAVVDYKVSTITGEIDNDINVKINLVKPCENHEDEEFYVDTSSKTEIKSKKSDIGLLYIVHDVRCYIDSIIDESSFAMKDRATKFIIDQILFLREEKGLDKN